MRSAQRTPLTPTPGTCFGQDMAIFQVMVSSALTIEGAARLATPAVASPVRTERRSKELAFRMGKILTAYEELLFADAQKDAFFSHQVNAMQQDMLELDRYP
jgi:hypothetical protein